MTFVANPLPTSLVFSFTLHCFQTEDPYLPYMIMLQAGQLLSPSLDRVEHEQKTSNRFRLSLEVDLTVLEIHQEQHR